MRDLTIRPYRASDENFLYDTWLKNYRDSHFAKRITPSVYFDMQRSRITNIMARAQTLIACAPDNENQIMGFLVFERYEGETVVHYTFVKAVFQRMGICKEMFKAAEINRDDFIFTHMTSVVDQVLGHGFSGPTYNPYRT